MVETKRLTLRPFVLADVAAHAELYSDSEVTRHLAGDSVSPEAVAARSRQVVESFAAHWAQHGFGVWAMMDRESGRLIGQCGLKHLPDTTDIEVLYALERARWGQGLAPEAAAAALRFGFQEVGLARIVAVTRPENRGSQRVLEKLGMRYEGERTVYGGILAASYAITREEFLAAQ